ncbi:sulfotransferase [Salinicola corii]|uniref:sulfotransferase n=1 Tax=Salinicola corii TaxID=2606937 RepID=UPI0016592A27|nr:sulfotransferase [Salinicola corii]
MKEKMKDEAYLDYGDRITDVSFEAKQTRAKRKLQFLTDYQSSHKAKIIHGHFYATKYLDIFPNAQYVTIVRDPRSLVPSYYSYLKRSRQNNYLTRFAKNCSSLEEFIDHEWFQNIVSKQLYPLDISSMCLVGVQQKYNEYLKRLSEIVGVALEEVNENVNPKGPEYNLPSGLVARIEANNSDDMELYFKALNQ